MDTRLSTLTGDWVAHLRASNYAPRTIKTYRENLVYLLKAVGDLPVSGVTHRVIEHWQANRLADGVSPSTTDISWRVLQQFFRWTTTEGETPDNPMTRVGRPKIPEHPVPVLGNDAALAIITGINRHTYRDARDEAILRLFLSTGIRLNELATLTTDKIDLDEATMTVMGKGRRPRTVEIPPRTLVAMRRYRRYRDNHRLTGLAPLWLGPKGAMTRSGIYQVVRDRARNAGVTGLHPHQLRHTFAHLWLSGGGSETGLMKTAGWRSRSMLDRYAASTAEARSREEARRLHIGDV